MKKIIIMIGSPGSGKGTQAKKIAEKYNYGHISTGDLLRALQANGNANEKQKKALLEMKQGKLVPDWLIYDLAFQEMDKIFNEGRGVVLDGAVRNIEQAKKYQQHIKEIKMESELIALEVSLSDEESFNRLTKRRVCEQCKELIPWLESTKELATCPKCNNNLVERQDDSEDIIRRRIEKQGNNAMIEILNYYRQLGVLKKVDGSKTIDEVELLIEKILLGVV
ncbi:MAG: nucleoside monophosphate kinase [bacterium]